MLPSIHIGSCHLLHGDRWRQNITLPTRHTTNASECSRLLLLTSGSCCRCDTPTPLRNKRLVHFHNWKEKAFCRQMEQLRAATEPVDMNVTVGSSEIMVFVLVGLGALFGILLVVGIVLQRRVNKKRTVRNRRLWCVAGFSSDIAARPSAILSHFPSSGNSFYGRTFLVTSVILSDILRFKNSGLLRRDAVSLR